MLRHVCFLLLLTFALGATSAALPGGVDAAEETFVLGKQINAPGGYSFQSPTLGKVTLTRVTASEGRGDDCRISLEAVVRLVEEGARANSLQSQPLPGGRGIVVIMDLQLRFFKEKGELIPYCSKAGTGCEVELELPDDYLLQRL